ncbi:hypothetical protein DY000_02048291 [Brassica cretica]|uniref:Uncharacterized protein n=1 Tax=Brassica cretica TaxID=69181 RepID=A0ABQ7ENP3_BRACR|nr:hypothetical protein DY000_02048291 [Brassica cretica]
MLVLLDSAELHRRSSQFKGAVRWSGKAARLRSGWCGGRPTFWIKGSGSRLCLAVVSLLLRFIPTFLRIEAMLFPLQCKVTLSSALSVSGCQRFLSTHSGICSKPWTALLSYGLGLLGALLQFLLLGLALSIGVTALARLVETGPMLLLLDEFLNS